ncbi:MAG: lysophospholipid acyltransferase family protein [Bacteroidaceae bacterium]|nr:lysophospholipid acyltransferase family protein [Bacteroidaceae bacterium]
MKTILYYILLAFLFVLNKLPFCILYALSDIIYFLVYYLVRYRRKIVRDNLVKSFPEKDIKEIKGIERRFYASLCDYFVETIKFYGMSEKEIRKRLVFTGLDDVYRMVAEGRSCVCYMGHFINWEYLVSISLYFNDENVVVGDIYHPLQNKRIDSLMKKMRDQYGAESITMANTLRRILKIIKDKKQFVIGFIADQVPSWESIHHWVDFLHRDTPVFTGTEKIAQRTKASLFFVKMKRVKRGHYTAHLELFAEDASEMAELEPTNRYYKLLEQEIKENPELWLWTHNRWKRTRAGFEEHERIRRENRKRLLKNE